MTYPPSPVEEQARKDAHTAATLLLALLLRLDPIFLEKYEEILTQLLNDLQ